MSSIQTWEGPSEEAMAEFLAGDRTAPVAVLNLFRFHEQALYPENDEAAQVSGREAMARYTSVAGPLVESLGGRMLFGAEVAQMLVGPTDAGWDQVVLMYFPARAAFLAMTEDADYQAACRHRTAALANWRQIILDGRQWAREQTGE